MAPYCDICGNDIDLDSKNYFYAHNAAHEDDVTACSPECLAHWVQEVIEHALTLAADLADKPRQSLVLLKERLTAELRARLPEAIAEERRMHTETFARPETRQRILDRFGQ